ncbi:MAG: ferrous iron transporter B, partial [Chloroflexales bacterium]|nr:ferrous iron transporter B [Chloroflexales bacterium]
MTPHLRVALAGNPNVGKSTIFNALTGGQQHVGNWPGKTVERATGTLRGPDRTIELVDLPGAYSLTAYSPEEVITRDYLVHERPDLVVNVVDAGNLERNLYLTLQIIETGAPLLLVLTMTDQAAQRGLVVNCAELSAALGGTPVVACVAHQSKEVADLREAVLHHTQHHCWKGGA